MKSYWRELGLKSRLTCRYGSYFPHIVTASVSRQGLRQLWFAGSS